MMKGSAGITINDRIREVQKNTVDRKPNVAELLACAWDRRNWKEITSVAFFFLVGDVEERLRWPIQSPNIGRKKKVNS